MAAKLLHACTMNIVIIEDSELIRTQLMHIISSQPRLHVVGTAAEEVAAVQLILELQPDAVLLDLSLSPGSGLRVLQTIREAGCAARVLILTNTTEEAIKDACHAQGISGFFDKSTEANKCLQQLVDWLPALPANESARLRTLRETGLLDSPQQEVFDDIARLARHIAGTPMALVSLVDQDRQWFLSHQGTVVRETSRSLAFCSHAILNSDVMEVCDALADPRFMDNPLVRGGPKVRYYLGVPLVLASSEALGTLCVVDTVARTLSKEQRDSLKILAHGVVSEIELRRKMARLEQEIDRRRTAENQMARMAMRDGLTQLPNRSALMDRLGLALRQCQRKAARMAFLFIDLDRYKLINDTLGHDAGDEALVEVAARLTGVLRDSDTVARLGGDEFAVLLPDIDHPASALAIAEKLNAALDEPAMLKGNRLSFSASIGVALYPEHGNSVEEIICNADLAMYQAKQAGGGAVHIYSPALGQRARDLLALENDLAQALQRNEIVAHYQPQVGLGRASLCGAEALARWQHPQLGVLGPDKFIGFAETRGFIQRIGQRVLELALAQLALWDAQGIEVPRIAVNVSPLELQETYPDWVAAALRRHALPATRLELEITESTLAGDNAVAMRVLETLRRQGIRIALDDFGVGYSSLGRLRHLPIDTLKIDRCFVREVTTNTQDSAIVSAVVTMSHSLGYRTVAEGAESPEHLAVLENLGCDSVQGFVWSKPVPPDEFLTWATGFIGAAHDNQPQPADLPATTHCAYRSPQSARPLTLAAP